MADMRFRLVGLVVSGLCLVLSGLTHQVRAVTIDWVDVGDPGNAADDTGYGAVANAFQIAKYEVTIGQYVEFLNAVAKTDTYGLYDASMATVLQSAGISQSGSSGSYTYTALAPAGTNPSGATSSTDRPITFVNWFDAARFANWIQNGQPTGAQAAGTTETGAYTLNGATSGDTIPVNPGAQVFLPTADQWYKAAFYKGGGTNAGYWEYAQGSDAVPGTTIGGTNMANWRNNATGYAVTPGSLTELSTQNYLTDVGAFTNSPSPYGTFDQGGNVTELIDLAGLASGRTGIAGAGWRYTFYIAASSAVSNTSTTSGIYSQGFRLANPVPEPSAVATLAAGAVSIGGLLRYRRRRASRRP